MDGSNWQKVVFVGDHEVGKTCIIRRYCEEKFSNSYSPTVGADYGYQLVELDHGKLSCNVTFWDMAGGEEFYETRRHLYDGATICFIVCDVLRKDFNKHVQKWTLEIKQHLTNVCVAVLINKMDLVESTSLSAISFKNPTLNMSAFKVSAKTGEGVRHAIHATLEQTCHN